jgi:hypothetical protein
MTRYCGIEAAAAASTTAIAAGAAAAAPIAVRAVADTAVAGAVVKPTTTAAAAASRSGLAVSQLLRSLRLTVPIFALRLFLLQRLPVRLRVLLRRRQLRVLIERVVLDACAASGAAADALLRYLRCFCGT